MESVVAKKKDIKINVQISYSFPLFQPLHLSRGNSFAVLNVRKFVGIFISFSLHLTSAFCICSFGLFLLVSCPSWPWGTGYSFSHSSSLFSNRKLLQCPLLTFLFRLSRPHSFSFLILQLLLCTCCVWTFHSNQK